MFIAERPAIEKCKSTVKWWFSLMAAAIVATEAAGLFVFLGIQASSAGGIIGSLKFLY